MALELRSKMGSSASVVAVIVTYHPDFDVFEQLLHGRVTRFQS